MPGTVDTENRITSLNMGLGTEQGAYLALPPPLAGCIGMRVAFRPYFETFDNGAVLPFSKTTSGGGTNRHHFYYDSTSWDYVFAIGLGFTNAIPSRDDSKSGGFGNTRGFLGYRTGSGKTVANRCAISYTSDAPGAGGWKIGNLGAGVQFPSDTAVGVSSLNLINNAFSDRPVRQGASGFDTYNNEINGSAVVTTSIETNDITRIRCFPANVTDGAKYTVGWDLRRNLSDESTEFRQYINTDSLVEANYMEVFSSWDHVTANYKISLSETVVDADDPFREGGATFNAPGFFIIKCALPSQVFRIAGFKLSYIYP